MEALMNNTEEQLRKILARFDGELNIAVAEADAIEAINKIIREAKIEQAKNLQEYIKVNPTLVDRIFENVLKQLQEEG